MLTKRAGHLFIPVPSTAGQHYDYQNATTTIVESFVAIFSITVTVPHTINTTIAIVIALFVVSSVLLPL